MRLPWLLAFYSGEELHPASGRRRRGRERLAEGGGGRAQPSLEVGRGLRLLAGMCQGLAEWGWGGADPLGWHRNRASRPTALVSLCGALLPVPVVC